MLDACYSESRSRQYQRRLDFPQRGTYIYAAPLGVGVSGYFLSRTTIRNARFPYACASRRRLSGDSNTDPLESEPTYTPIIH
jgi:hypothetical protein